MKASKKQIAIYVSMFFITTVLIVLFITNRWDIFPQKGKTNTSSNNILNEKEEDTNMDFDALDIKIIREGSGVGSVNGDTLLVHYEGTLKDGTKFDSSYDRGTPFEFVLGAGEVITGWDDGLKDMKVGEIRELRIPSSLGYGSSVMSSIPANSGLIFKVELLEIR